MGACCGDERGDKIIEEPDIKTMDKKPMKNMVVEVKKKIKVYGNSFNSDTRTIRTLLDISNTEYDYEEIDIFMGEHQKDKYLAKNPSGSIPMIIDDNCMVLGSPEVFVNYLCAT